MNERKGQGALEYLLIIGGMIAVAVLVIIVLSRIAGEEKGELTYALTDTEINRGVLACKTNVNGDSCKGFCDRGLGAWTYHCCPGVPNLANEKECSRINMSTI